MRIPIRERRSFWLAATEAAKRLQQEATGNNTRPSASELRAPD